MALSYNLGYQESISVHPTRRQNFAGKPYSNFPNIWEWLILSLCHLSQYWSLVSRPSQVAPLSDLGLFKVIRRPVLRRPRNLASYRQTTVTRVPSVTKMHKIRQKKVPTGTSTFHCHSHSSPTRMRLSSTPSNHGSQAHTRLRHLFDQQLLQHLSFFKSFQILIL